MIRTSLSQSETDRKMKTNLLQKLRLGSTGISHNADVDITAECCLLHCLLRNATKEHQKNASFDLVTAIDGGKQALDEIVIQIDKFKKDSNTMPIKKCE